ncbi:hypothetical protein IHE44_0005487 [Lamprotornis superbus]|uniref:HEPN domain-containing protein n=1 Tax=Lamprotornis superbus TaxID=245042 RepID=A0A835NMQ4_9PASS|nr:hypothetical protein IHE44_0005487 [Lamprotornis superbus]
MKLSDDIKIVDLQKSQDQVFLELQSKGLKGGGRFGQTTPPLVDFLKDILRRYPEGGQILKELIQNAEDAGPAFYAYNDAIFTPEDWHGIQEIARSRKKDDPLKVGRFGIGFNSVYHITDVPSIFSGDQIGMLDPHQTLFGPHESGQCWNLKEDSKEINELTDQFAPFIGVFGSTKETFKNGSFPGTFFRFPLRLQPSQLSSNVYDKQKVLELFESFRADADTVLLFLKSVQDVSLHVREADGTERLVFRVTASENKALKHERPNSIKILGTAINQYCKGVPSNSITCVTYHAKKAKLDFQFISLFPGLEGRLLSDDLKPEVLAALKEAAKSRGRPCTQLQLLNPERFARLVKEVMNSVWPGRDVVVQWYPGLEEKKHPSVSWLKMVWRNLYIHFSDDLSVFDEMPLIPKTLLDENQTSVELKIYLKSEQSLSEQESKQSLHIMLSIIRWLYSNQIPASLHTPMPLYSGKLPYKLAMKPIHECCYCDIKVDDLNDLLEDSVEPIILVHEDIPMKTAEWLNVPCLSTRLINPENMGFEQSGQREPLTVRIKNILEEYPSISDIFKELLQNADDANATECNFLIDMRRNMDIRENLLDPGMAACHGPALWSFNNSEFSDSDFLNITRLGESLKRSEVDKVGKFGLGFNSVYHITDVPIILSREFMIMFDPNVNHISKHIRDKSNPGIKINWSKQQKRLRKFPNQFKPFIGVFGCQLPLTVESPYSYKGTLFRLSFRTQQEAKEIDAELRDPLMRYVLNEKLEEFSGILRATPCIPCSLDGHPLVTPSRLIHPEGRVAKLYDAEDGRFPYGTTQDYLNPVILVKLVQLGMAKDDILWEDLIEHTRLALLPAKSLCYNDCPWIKVKDTTVKYCHGDIPREVAVKLGAIPKRHKALERYASNICFTTLGTEFGQKEKLTSRIKSILNAYPSEKEMLKELLQNADDAKATEICFVFDPRQHPADRIFDEKWAPLQGPALCVYNNQPFTEDDIRGIQNLGKETGLPFHVNGHFALDSARRNLWRDDNGVGVRSDWNSSLMTALIAPAYVELLIQLKKRLDIQPDWYCLVKAVYNCIYEDLKRLLPVMRAPNVDGSDLHSAVIITWVNMSTVNKGRPFFDNLLQDELQHLKNTEYNITTRKTVAENVYRLKHLLLEIGFNLVYNCDETANLYHCLVDADIPVTYVTPADVRLFLMTFSFPDSNCHIGKLPCRLQQTNLKLFHSLKLLVDYCFKDAEENEIQIEGLPLLITLDNVLQVFDSKRPKFLTTYHELIPSRKDLFMNTLYLRYNNILLSSEYQEVNGTLPLIRFNGAQVNPKFKQTDVLQLLWTSCPILPEKATPLSIKEQEGSSLGAQEQLEQVLAMLNVNLDPPLDKVINNCRNICNITTLDEDMVKTRAKVLRSIYEFLSTEKREFRFQLRGVSFIMVEEGWKLLKPEEVVINLEYESDFKPYLYKLPLELGTFHQLFKHLGTEDIISTKQYVEVLGRIYKSSEGKQLDPNEMRTVKRVVSGLFKSLQNDSVKHSDSKDINFLLALAMTLKSATDNLISDTSYLIAMLGCNDIYRISEKLDSLGVKSVGNPVEARRWLRQARANFSAARNDLHKNANEWVCFKCYLSTKLALIAADYAVKGKSDKDIKPAALAQKVEEYSQQLEGLSNDVQTLEAYGVDSLKTSPAGTTDCLVELACPKITKDLNEYDVTSLKPEGKRRQFVLFSFYAMDETILPSQIKPSAYSRCPRDLGLLYQTRKSDMGSVSNVSPSSVSAEDRVKQTQPLQPLIHHVLPLPGHLHSSLGRLFHWLQDSTVFQLQPPRSLVYACEISRTSAYSSKYKTTQWWRRHYQRTWKQPDKTEYKQKKAYKQIHHLQQHIDLLKAFVVSYCQRQTFGQDGAERYDDSHILLKVFAEH